MTAKHGGARVVAALMALALASPAAAGGEAGPIALRDQGFFSVGGKPVQVQATGLDGQPTTGTVIENQMYVGFQLPLEKRHRWPLLLVHGGGSQSTDWMGTPDGRDGWLDYFLAAGFDVYFVDRPGWGRSPNAASYGAMEAPMTSETIATFFTQRSQQFPGGGAAASPEIMEFSAMVGPGPSSSNAILKQGMAELLDRIGPVILVTTSAGGTAGWLALDARPDKVKGVLAIESLVGVTDALAPLIGFAPPLPPGETIATEQRPPESAGAPPCALQPDGRARTMPALSAKPVGYVVAPESLFAGTGACSVRQLNQLGANAKLLRLTDHGIEGNGHLMSVELNNGEIANKVLIPWLASIE